MSRRMARGRMDSVGGGFLRGSSRSERIPKRDKFMSPRWAVAVLAYQRAMSARTL